MSLPVGIGLAGLGRWGRNYVKTLLGLPECRLVAVADPGPAARAAVSGQSGIVVHESAAGLLADPRIEAVVIATPDHTHYSLAEAALVAGRDVLVEKPMALTPTEAEALVLRAAAGDRVLAVGHTAVYQAGFAELSREVRAWPAAAERRASAVRTSSGYTDGRSNPILDLCPHDLALGILLFGTPAAARARLNGRCVEYDVKFVDQALLNGRAEWREPPHIRRMQVQEAEHTLNDQPGGRAASGIGDTPLGRQCLDFIEACRSRRQPVSNGRLGLDVVRCLNALAASARDGGAWIGLLTDGAGSSPSPSCEPLAIGVRA